MGAPARAATQALTFCPGHRPVPSTEGSWALSDAPLGPIPAHVHQALSLAHPSCPHVASTPRLRPWAPPKAPLKERDGLSPPPR